MVARVALKMGNRVLPQYAHKFVPGKYTRPQLHGCLVLKRFFRTNYRGVCVLLEDLPSLREELGLRKVPHLATLQHAHAKTGPERADAAGGGACGGVRGGGERGWR